MAAPPRAAPAIIDNATVYRVFMIALSIARRTPASESALEIMLRSREGAQSRKFGRAAAIAFSYDYGHTSTRLGSSKISSTPPILTIAERIRDPSLGILVPYLSSISWGHGAVQRVLLAELQKQRHAISTMSLLRIICDGDDPTYSQGQSGRRALRALAREGVVIAQRSSAGMLFWQITHPGHR